ncbi:MBL fold metallo-hydrolase [Oerskovia enterophila]|uniref:Hydroxyacylglutathione hydrolase n=1 Tax=Oerskovia enterophila TaxID=43678 RepID=A0ABX2Y825_9CELL|nr:MBL fold metallo-hydrolase [Oerskovia enterophila]OCI32747.1 hydroxyacylglutathione hydrolase [Oerskovia enterophila]
MGYTGDVTVGGPRDLRVLDEVEVRKLAVGPSDNNAYLLTCRRSGAQLLVDAAAEPDRLAELVREGSPSARLDMVVTTHRHRDHIAALASLVAVTGATVAVGEPDADAVTRATEVGVGRSLHDGDTLVVGHLTLGVVALRGHTPGSVALAYREPEHATAPGAVPGRAHLFTGDSLFPGGVGNTEQDPGRFALLYADVTERLFDRFDDATWVYPGHGADTTLGTERPHLEEWRARGW